MTLQEQLNQIRAGAKIRIPEENRTIMRNATDHLVRSGRLAQALKAGDPTPDFILHDTTGASWSSQMLRCSRPLLITFFRGHW
jgi:hypothetical protein